MVEWFVFGDLIIDFIWYEVIFVDEWVKFIIVEFELFYFFGWYVG